MADSGAVPPVFSGHLGRRVRFYRLQAELTQSQLARRAGLNQGFLSEIERGRRRPSAATARAIAAALDLPVAVLVGEGPDHDAPQPLETRHLPLVDEIPVTPPDPAAAGESFPVLRHLYAANRYCLRLTLDSMEPTLKPGDIVLVEYRRSARPEHVVGRICACLIAGRPLLARVFLEQRDGQAVVVLRPDHPDAAQEIVDPSELSIQGVITHLVSRSL